MIKDYTFEKNGFVVGDSGMIITEREVKNSVPKYVCNQRSTNNNATTEKTNDDSTIGDVFISEMRKLVGYMRDSSQEEYMKREINNRW